MPRRPSPPRLCFAPPLTLALLACGCGPSAAQVGGAVLVAAPFIYLTTHGLLYLLSRLWRRRYPELRAPLKLWLIIPAVVLATLAAVLGPRRTVEWTFMALWLPGTSNILISTVIWRIWFAVDPDRSFSHAQIPFALFSTVVAVAALLTNSKDIANTGMLVWIFVGYGGAIAAPIYIAAVIEAAIRGKVRRPKGHSGSPAVAPASTDTQSAPPQR